MEGPLSKWTNVVKGWQYRWFVLDDNTGLLSYYTVGTNSLMDIVYFLPFSSYLLRNFDLNLLQLSIDLAQRMRKEMLPLTCNDIIL